MKQVLSIGQCGMDHNSLVRFLKKNFAVEIVPSATEADATSQLRRKAFDLVLVNRQFDADGTEGVDFIERLKADKQLSTVPVMLITNFQEYADDAVAKGAVPGFGKSDLGSAKLVAHLKPFLDA